MQGRPSHKCFHQLARLNQVPRKRSTAAPSSALKQAGRTGAGLGAGPGSVAGEPLLPEPAGPGLARKAARRAGCGRAGLVRAPSARARAWPASVERGCHLPRAGGQRPGAAAHEPCGEGDGTAAPERAGVRRRQRHRGRRVRAARHLGPAAERGCGIRAGPGRVRAGRRGPAVVPGWPGRAQRRRPNVLEAWRAGGQLPSFRNCAWISRTRKQQSAAPASAQSAFRSCIAECPLGRRPPSRAAKVQAPHQRPAGCSRRGRPLAPSIRANAALRRDWRCRSGSRAVSFWAGGGERAGARGGGGRGGEVSTEARAAAAAAPAARPPARAAGRREPGRGGVAAAAP